MKRIIKIVLFLDMSTFIFDHKEKLIEVTVIRRTERALKVADLIAKAVVMVFILLNNNLVEDVVDNCDQQVSQDDNVENSACNEYGPSKDGIQ